MPDRICPHGPWLHIGILTRSYTVRLSPCLSRVFLFWLKPIKLLITIQAKFHYMLINPAQADPSSIEFRFYFYDEL